MKRIITAKLTDNVKGVVGTSISQIISETTKVVPLTVTVLSAGVGLKCKYVKKEGKRIVQV